VSLNAETVGQGFSFVMDEIGRLGAMGVGVMKHLEGLDFLCSIRGPDGRHFFTGRPAYNRLRELSTQALESSAHHRRISPDKAFQAVLEGFGRTYARKDFGGSTDAEDLRNLRGWIDEAAIACVTLTHVIPCRIGLPEGQSFTLGPVTITAGATAVGSIEPRLKAWADDRLTEPGKDRTWDVDNTLSYLKAFQDLASVTIDGCDPAMSKRAATEAVQATLDYIHIMAGAGNTRKMRIGGPALKGDRRARLAWTSDGEPNLGWSTRWEGANIEDEFWSWLVNDDQRAITEAAAAAVQTIVDRRKPELIAARYLDAAAWYADAAREQRPPAAVVKYLTAMERLLWTGESGEGITARLAERAAALCFNVDEWNFEALEKYVRAAYKLRSGIVHGSLAADSPVILKNYRLCETVVRDMLITWLDRYGDGMNRPTTIKRAKIYFDGFVAQVRADLAQRATASSKQA
jgi:hypothetical protein